MSKESIPKKEVYVNNLTKYMGKWKKEFELSVSEKRSNIIWKAVLKFLNLIFLKNLTFDEQRWIGVLNAKIKKDISLLKELRGRDKDKLKCWIGINKSTIEMLSAGLEFNAFSTKMNQSRKEFINKQNFRTAQNHISNLNRLRIVLKKFGDAYTKNAKYRNRLILLTKQKIDLKDINWTEAILTDIFVFYYTEQKVPITTLVKIVSKFGIITWSNVYLLFLQTKKFEMIRDKFLMWENILHTDLKIFKVNYRRPA